MNKKNKIDVIVLGAGVGGLGAGCWLKKHGFEFKIMEYNPKISLNLHNGVHYLHEIPELPFASEMNKITLTDAILSQGKFYHEPNLQFALDYSEKVRDVQHPSSIMSVGKRDYAYMPGKDMNSLLLKMYEYIGSDNFDFGTYATSIDTKNKTVLLDGNTRELCEYEHIISTIPLDTMFKFIQHRDEDIEFIKKSIYITNYKVANIVPNWMINLYLPSKELSPYRASLLNGICSVESMEELSKTEIEKTIPSALSMFDLESVSKTESYMWKNGKIMSISTGQRKRVVNMLQDMQIYQIGRFGLWNRKLLVDNTINQAKAVVSFLKNGGWDEALSKLVL